jgi:hypothetical protein
MVLEEQIRQYDIAYFAGGSGAGGYQYRAIIGLRRDDGSLIGGAYFHRDRSTIPECDERDASGYVWCHMGWEDFPRVVDLLRHEEPVFLRYAPAPHKIASFTTSLEPVGEDEPHRREPAAG